MAVLSQSRLSSEGIYERIWRSDSREKRYEDKSKLLKFKGSVPKLRNI